MYAIRKKWDTKNSLYLSRLNWNGGFTLVESLMHLVMFLIFAQLIFLLFIYLYERLNIYPKVEEFEWNFFVLDLNYYFDRSTVIRVGLNEKNRPIIVFSDPNNNTSSTNYILFESNYIYKSSPLGGLEYLLTYVKNARFELQGDVLKVIVEMESGKRKEKEFIVELYQ